MLIQTAMIFVLSIDKYEAGDVYGKYVTADHLELVDTIDEDELDEWLGADECDYDAAIISDLRSLDSSTEHALGWIHDHESRTMIISDTHENALKIFTDTYLNITK